MEIHEKEILLFSLNGIFSQFIAVYIPKNNNKFSLILVITIYLVSKLTPKISKNLFRDNYYINQG